MKALMKLVDYLTETGMREEDAHELLSAFLEEEAINYIDFRNSLKKKVNIMKKKVAKNNPMLMKGSILADLAPKKVAKKKVAKKKATPKKKVAKKAAKKNVAKKAVKKKAVKKAAKKKVAKRK